MAAPIPQNALSGHCSVIDNNTLYVLSSDSFQALPLVENATWTSLDMGTAVTGPTCLRAVSNGDESQASLYVIGGESDDSSYGGLQRYVFSNKSWETLDLPTEDMKGRTDHSAAYLNDSSSILVYAGSRSGVQLSSQTFVISTESPYNIESFSSQAPPVNNPILLPFDSSSAVMLGGAESNTGIWTFSKSSAWQRLDTNLTSALPEGAKGALVTGTDGSKVLTVYDASASPNEVTQLVLLGANGEPASNGQTVGDSSTSSSRKRKRDLTLENWPAYNSSSAPAVKRSDYSVAQNDQGTLAVISGGNDDTPVNVFNQTSNSWVSNEVLFGGSNNQIPLTTTSASSSSALPTSTAAHATSSSSAKSSGSGDGGAHTRKVLGITLGLLCGIAVVIIIALLYMRRRKQQAKKTDVNDEKADRMSFQDRGASFMKEAGGAVSETAPKLPPPPFNGGYDPRSSFAILAGKLGADRFSQRFSKYGGGAEKPAANGNPYAGLEPPKKVYNNANANDSSVSVAIISGKYGNQHSRGNGEKGSFESTTKLVRSPTSPQSFEDPMELESMDGQTPRLAHGTRPPMTMASVRAVGNDEDMQKKRSSGWSRYFANQSDGGAYDPAAQNSPNLSAATSPNLSVSDYTPSISRNPSAMVAPLDIEPKSHLHPADANHHRLSTVTLGRPSFSHSVEDFSARGASFDMAEGQRADFHTGQSLESQGYLGDARESFSSSRRHSMSSVASSQFFSQRDSWTPINGAATIATAQATNRAQPVNGRSPNSPVVKEVHIPPSPSISTAAFPRPPSSTYTADFVRDSRMTGVEAPNALGRALSPPAAVAIPGPAARNNGNGSGGFFPGSGTRAIYDRPNLAASARKIGPLHPGTLAALRYTPERDAPQPPVQQGLGISTEENRDSSATIWPSATGAMTQREREEAFRQRLEMERQAKERMDAGGARKTKASDISWVDIGQD